MTSVCKTLQYLISCRKQAILLPSNQFVFDKLKWSLKTAAKRASIIHGGQFQFTVMLFALRNGAIFLQHLMNEILSGLTYNKCFVF